jgi:hypothetical protein
MQQLSFLEPPSQPQQDLARVWQSLEEERRARLVARLAQLIAAAVVHTPGEHDGERTE